MQSMRHRSGENTPSIPKPPPAPPSFSKWKGQQKAHSSKKLKMYHILIFLIGCMLISYVFILSRFQKASHINGGGVTPETSAKTVPKRNDNRKKIMKGHKVPKKKEWVSPPYGTPEGQRKLRDAQRHVPKNLSELIPKLRLMRDKYPAIISSDNLQRKIFKAYSKENKVQVNKKYDKKGNLMYSPITSIKKEDLVDMGFNQKQIDDIADISYEDAIRGRERLVDILHEAGIDDIDPEAIALLPKWSSVTKLYGDKPVILGLERCEEFRNQTDPIDASLGTAGMFNTGTNPLSMYISNNCKMPTNKKDRAGGTRWQVPWGKHMLASHKLTNTAQKDGNVNKTNVLPVVAVRDPFTWMQSMCKHKYEARWHHDDGYNCPNLAKPKLNADGTPNLVPLKVNYDPVQSFKSLAHYWGIWYKEYLEADYPRLIVRFEDIHFHARELVETICQCAGAVPREEDELFRYVTDTAKWGSAHHSKSNMISSMIKYGTDTKRIPKGMKESDWLVAREVLTPEILDLFGYEIPEKLLKDTQ